MIDESMLAIIAVVIAALALLVMGYFIPKHAVKKKVPGSKNFTTFEQLTAENERRKTFFEVVGAILLIIGVVFTYLQLQNTRDQLEISESAQLTDRLVKTIQQVGSERQAEQIGGMYGLRSLAVDAVTKGDLSYLEILNQTLSAFIRQHAPWPCISCTPNNEARPSDAVQVALYVLGDREDVLKAPRLADSRRDRMVNLREVDLRGADLTGLYLVRVDFRGSNLSFADIHSADVSESDLSGTTAHELVGRHTVRGTGTRWS